jgi:hypothetical protein
MILRDRITVVRRVVIGRDRYGNDVLQDPEHTYAAEIRPRGSQEPIEGPFTTRYRVFLPASADDVTPADAVRWRGATLKLQGDVEPHTFGGRLHHFEVIAQRTT